MNFTRLSRRAFLASWSLLALWGAVLHAEDRSSIELLLPTGTLYAMSGRSYRSLKLPTGWTVAAGAYSPDETSLALVLVGVGVIPTKVIHSSGTIQGPINKVVQLWTSSARLAIIDRKTGNLTRTWRLSATATEWSVEWIGDAVVRATGHTSANESRHFRFDTEKNIALPPTPAMPSEPTTVDDSTGCPKTLSETTFKGKEDRFIVERAYCSTPPETSDFYRLVRENPKTQKDAILWEYRVSADTTSCLAPYACYSGESATFLSTADQLFLAWDGDVFTLDETDDGMKTDLVTQLLPQYGHPLAIARGETHLNTLDLINKVTFQPANANLSIAHTGTLNVYAQNLCARRGFNATLQAGPYTKNMMVPAGYQVGPVALGDFKDRAYTPILINATWTSFHHLAEPVRCAEPYTILPTTKGLVVSISEGDHGQLNCRIDFQEE